MENNGFIHRQYYAYISDDKMLVPQTSEFFDKYPWGEKCAKGFDTQKQNI